MAAATAAAAISVDVCCCCVASVTGGFSVIDVPTADGATGGVKVAMGRTMLRLTGLANGTAGTILPLLTAEPSVLAAPEAGV